MRALNEAELEERKRKVLQLVIHEFVRTGKPVGSQSISASSRLGLSSATVRNIFSELEKDELIAQPHTSAGRVPTDKGYRFYVDSLIELQRLAVQEQDRIRKEYESRIQEIEGLLSQTSRMLSSLSHYTGFVMAPKLERNVFSHLELVPLDRQQILVAMVTQSGLTKHFIITTDVEIPRERLRAIARLITQSFQGSTLQEVQLRMMERLESALTEYQEIVSLAKEIGQGIRRFSDSSIYLDGTANILSLPDFSKTDDLRDLFRMMEEKQALGHFLESEILEKMDETLNAALHLKGKGARKPAREATEEAPAQVQVRIGSENAVKAFQNLSVVTSTYRLTDRTVGVLGILGPKRMEYPKMIALVDYVSKMVNHVLQEFDRK